jgi:hypothetical protein
MAGRIAGFSEARLTPSSRSMHHLLDPHAFIGQPLHRRKIADGRSRQDLRAYSGPLAQDQAGGNQQV